MNALEKYVTKVKLAQALRAKTHSKADLAGAMRHATRRGMNFRMDPAKTLKRGPMIQNPEKTHRPPAEMKALLSDPKKLSASHALSNAINRGMKLEEK